VDWRRPWEFCGDPGSTLGDPGGPGGLQGAAWLGNWPGHFFGHGAGLRPMYGPWGCPKSTSLVLSLVSYGRLSKPIALEIRTPLRKRRACAAVYPRYIFCTGMLRSTVHTHKSWSRYMPRYIFAKSVLKNEGRYTLPVYPDFKISQSTDRLGGSLCMGI